ncbi:hypothetical protein HTZ84_22565 [Haloterrigena sp. SYSU A558-1]|uniref:Uncharacterized protein n=1 Tax=Haloterrigena gelatinilytica TaxID=2741724 RepID=A0ABX2LFM6_9EURY|nr:hypothetical protein [Haloterrigena gelatinilytica]NUC75052.1 hypothetical protein [Haloterrigena gelatinilytica]
MEQTLTIDETQENYRQVQRKLRRGKGSKDDRQTVKEKLAEIESELAYVLGDQGFEEFVSERLTHYRKNLDENTAMCSCWRTTCPLKQGKVPPSIRQHGTELTGRQSPSDLVAEWLQRHDGGEALALIRKEWARMVVRVHVALDDAKEHLEESTYLKPEDELARNVGLTPPGERDTGDSSSDDSSPADSSGHSAVGVADD